ncbi:energy-coupling factor transport system substrate-specific component [Sporobacter termitidis DSM 10068]|uniref:Energy-coupling factor transport system substrate-specific component n=1 Tax=Sporobacter termitidis DSM 10068 TaxID=1123282 RepID=A0A1M5ZFR5_9FIRM|nr:MptD family putative ECF transporter S component [Sporobacter termitidis]SHI23077.1 energy-coupling factor transport system substrate-specific component [Sporobacter termitidis DSM 10068]
MIKKKLTVKDLIVAGAFAALYVVIMLVIVSTASLTPVTWLMAPLLCAVVLGTVYMLYCMKIPKRGAILILGVVVSLVLSSTGGWAAPAWGIICALLAELLAALGRYGSKGWYAASFCVFACSTAGPFWMLVFAKAAVLATIENTYGAGFAARMDALTPPWIVPVVIGSAVLGGFIGGAIGKRLLKKHFEKAGVV